MVDVAGPDAGSDLLAWRVTRDAALDAAGGHVNDITDIEAEGNRRGSCPLRDGVFCMTNTMVAICRQRGGSPLW